MHRVALSFFLAGSAALASAQADYPGASWSPADSTNQSTSNRPTTFPIRYVIIHVTEGSFAGSVSWFQNPTSNVSAHFVIRSSDGFITQMVRLKDIAWHAGNSMVNNRSVGIEHEARTTISASNPNPNVWFTDAMYRASADLTRWLTTQYGIPRTYNASQTPTSDVNLMPPGILGHKQVSLGGTACPSTYWDWARYMSLVTRGANYESDTMPVYINPGDQVEVIVRMRNTSDFTWTRAAGTNQVTLRTEPSGRVSPFFVSGNWTSSSNLGVALTDVAPNGVGEWRFQWRAPSTPGTFTENLQLHHSSTGLMGPVLSFNVGVGRIDKVVDNTSNDFWTSGGTWTTATSATDKFGADYRFFTTSARTPAFSEWQLNAPLTGTYEVYAWWPQGTNRSAAVTYEVRGRRDPFVRVVNQQTGGGQWNLLGRVSLNAGGGAVRVFARSSSPTVVMADAVRLVGPIR